MGPHDAETGSVPWWWASARASSDVPIVRRRGQVPQSYREGRANYWNTYVAAGLGLLGMQLQQMTPEARWSIHAAIDALLWKMPMHRGVNYYAKLDSFGGQHRDALVRAARATGMTARQRRLQPKERAAPRGAAQATPDTQR